MATWHQQRARMPYYHVTQWSIVTDPPGECCSIMLAASEEAARKQVERWRTNGRDMRHTSILPPCR